MSHPLHPEEFIARARAGGYYDSSRRTGRTTAIALRTIAEAIERPYTKVPIRDHVGTPGMDRYLARMIIDIIKALHLHEMSVDLRGPTLTFGTKP